jgi:p-aminobenzoyl-glutamate transporter AbgT
MIFDLAVLALPPIATLILHRMGRTPDDRP